MALADADDSEWQGRGGWVKNMMGYYWPMMGGWGFGGMMIFNLIFGILIIVGLIYLVRYLARGGHSQISAEDSALKILKERYARGEIDKKEFEEKIKDLR